MRGADLAQGGKRFGIARLQAQRLGGPGRGLLQLPGGLGAIGLLQQPPEPGRCQQIAPFFFVGVLRCQAQQLLGLGIARLAKTDLPQHSQGLRRLGALLEHGVQIGFGLGRVVRLQGLLGRSQAQVDGVLGLLEQLGHGRIVGVAPQVGFEPLLGGHAGRQALQNAPPYIAQPVGVDAGLARQWFHGLRQGQRRCALGLVNLQGDQAVFQLPRLLVHALRRLARRPAGLGFLAGTGHNAVVLRAQGARLRRAIREQGAGNFSGFFFPTGTGQQAHAGQLFLLGPVHAHQGGQVVGRPRLRVVLAQAIEDFLRFLGLLFQQCDIAQLGQTGRRLGVGQQ